MNVCLRGKPRELSLAMMTLVSEAERADFSWKKLRVVSQAIRLYFSAVRVRLGLELMYYVH
jgi:hypothetical protein